ncbi:hypothetical protein M9H77_22550 [Catharanthus roseus]|uniref:Uncharacterized protein n=1 Tax=Catharanthus roseus TaxID=4058 RepID=A0ACC0ATB6_CATRO|nr:hypothetical protein M9H77_22550 [Catharanthus roseus]
MSRGLVLCMASPPLDQEGLPARVAQGSLAGIYYGMPKFVPKTPFKFPDFVLEPIIVHIRLVEPMWTHWIRQNWGLPPRVISPVPRDTQIPFLAAVDLAEGYGVRELEIADRLTSKVALMRETLEAQQ